MGQLIPIANYPVLPGDSVQQQTNLLLRVTPQLKPVMHPTQVYIRNFYVPYRLVWSGWEDFITGSSATPPPTITGGAHSEGTLSDYLGVYNDASNDFNALHVRAYNKIVNEYFIDGDIDSEVSEDTDSIFNVRWAKDRFTAARPWAQAGSAVTLPIGTKAPIYGDMDFDGVADSDNYLQVLDGPGGSLKRFSSPGSGNAIYGATSGSGTKALYADLSSADAIDIREFREAFALQRYQEARARYGSDYVDYLRYVGVRPSDARLQRPEYLSGSRQTISFSEVLNTASNAGTDPIGDLGGHGIAALRSNKYRRYFEEHGVVMTLMYVRPKSIYVNGLPKEFSKSTKEDYFQKELENVGAEEVLNKEIYAAHTTPDGTFGYSNMYDEYRNVPSYVSAEYRNSTSYDWHFGRIFSSDPALNPTFLECSPTKRVFADQTEDSLWVMANHSIQARRMVSNRKIGSIL